MGVGDMTGWHGISAPAIFHGDRPDPHAIMPGHLQQLGPGMRLHTGFPDGGYAVTWEDASLRWLTWVSEMLRP